MLTGSTTTSPPLAIVPLRVRGSSVLARNRTYTVEREVLTSSTDVALDRSGDVLLDDHRAAVADQLVGDGHRVRPGQRHRRVGDDRVEPAEGGVGGRRSEVTLDGGAHGGDGYRIGDDDAVRIGDDVLEGGAGDHLAAVGAGPGHRIRTILRDRVDDTLRSGVRLHQPHRCGDPHDRVGDADRRRFAHDDGDRLGGVRRLTPRVGVVDQATGRLRLGRRALRPGGDVALGDTAVGRDVQLEDPTGSTVEVNVRTAGRPVRGRLSRR